MDHRHGKWHLVAEMSDFWAPVFVRRPSRDSFLASGVATFMGEEENKVPLMLWRHRQLADSKCILKCGSRQELDFLVETARNVVASVADPWVIPWLTLKEQLLLEAEDVCSHKSLVHFLATV